MLGFFRINDPYRLVVILILLILASLPVWVNSNVLTQPELHWMVVGERLAGGAVLYVDIWDETGPLAAFTYKLMDYLFGRSALSYHILGLILFFIQAGYFNLLLLRHKVLTENNYVPAFVYALLGLLIHNQITLSPALMGMTFIIPAFDNLFFHLQARIKFDTQLVNVGLLTGIASLFYLPLIYFMLIWVLALLFYSATITRRYMLMMYGVLFVFFILWIFYIWKGETDKLYIDYLSGLFRGAAHRYMGMTDILKFIAFPFAIFLINLFSVYNQPGYNNFQSRIQSFFILYMVIYVPVWLIYSDHSGNNLVLFIPGLSFFIAQGVIFFRKPWKRELMFLLLFVYILGFNYSTYYNLFDLQDKTGLSDVAIREVSCPVPIEGKKILVIGDDVNYYLNARQATPYFSWRISGMQLKKLDYYDNLVDIYRNFEEDLPEVIIDLEDVIREVFDKIPLLEQKYLLADEKGIYVLNEEY